MAYRVMLERLAEAALDALRASDRSRVSRAIAERLMHEPLRMTTNRKPTEPGAPAPWELRVQPYRVYYDVDEGAGIVWVVDIARKDRETAGPVR